LLAPGVLLWLRPVLLLLSMRLRLLEMLWLGLLLRWQVRHLPLLLKCWK
jgi:hypothetical protein